MALGDGIRRNIASIDASERTLLRDALVELNHRLFAGSKSDAVPGGVSHWFKMDEIHQSTHVHHGPEFVPWHRELVNYMESELRSINPLLSMHYWDWTQDPRDPFGDGSVNLLTSAFMGNATGDVGDPWLSAGYYNPITADHRDATGNPADPPNSITRNVEQNSFEPGAQLALRAALTEYALPVAHRAQMQVELTRPDTSVITLGMNEFEPGRFEVTTQATIAGVYHARIMAKGVTLRGTPFTREQLCSAAVWKGGDQPYHPPVGNGKDDWCRLLSCLLNEKHITHELEEQLKRFGIEA